jgi:hypothetical protein
MHSLIQLQKTAPVFVVTLVCVGLLPTMQAVSPPPDGAYTGANTAEGGSGTLFSLTTGSNNTALGSEALYSLTTGIQNTATGAQSLKNNTGDRNTADGFQALIGNTSGDNNTATGWRALFSNSIGSYNAANGAQALYKNTMGSENTAIGNKALHSNTTGDGNVAVGTYALFNNTGAGSNTVDGANVAIGPFALMNATGSGFIDGGGNNAVGEESLKNNVSGWGNNAIGYQALYDNVNGSQNTALGEAAGARITGNNNVCIGAEAGGNPGENNTIHIADNTPTNIGASACFIGGIDGQVVDTGTGTAVYVDGAGKLGTIVSSKRFKEDIRPIGKTSESLYALQPVSFRYTKAIDSTGTSQFGLVAEEVEKVNPHLVVRDKGGKPYSVRYDQVNAMLLNEFLKEHRKVETLEATVANLVRTVKDQASEMQKVRAQLTVASPSHGGLEVSKFATGRIRGGGPAPRVVSNP